MVFCVLKSDYQLLVMFQLAFWQAVQLFSPEKVMEHWDLADLAGFMFCLILKIMKYTYMYIYMCMYRTGIYIYIYDVFAAYNVCVFLI